MKIHEILTEAIESKRENFRKILSDNKEKLQKSKTRLGVIKNLRRMFPDVKFSMFASSDLGNYSPHSKVIKVFNHKGVFSAKTVRNDWEKFVTHTEDILSHETIHKDQYSRDQRDQPSVLDNLRKQTTASKETRKKAPKFFQEWMNLNDLLDDYKRMGDNEAFKETQTKIEKLVAKAKRAGVTLQGSRRDYLGDRLEITAFAEQAAEDLLKVYSGRDFSNEQLRKYAIQELQFSPDPAQHSSIIGDYLKHFETNEKVAKQFYKQVIRYIEMKTQ